MSFMLSLDITLPDHGPDVLRLVLKFELHAKEAIQKMKLSFYSFCCL